MCMLPATAFLSFKAAFGMMLKPTSVPVQSLLRAVGMFSASVFVIVNFGDAFAV